MNSKYNKFFVALAGAIITVIAQHFEANSIVQAVLPIASALGVYQVRNK